MKYISVFLFMILMTFDSQPVLSSMTEGKTVIKTIQYLGKKGAGEVIQIELSQKVTPRVIKLSGESPRLVFDFPNTVRANEIANNTVVDGIMIKGIRVGAHNQPELKIRVVIDLKKKTEYKMNHGYEDTTPIMYIHFSRPPAAKARPQQIEAPAESLPAPPKSTSELSTSIDEIRESGKVKKSENSLTPQITAAQKKAPPTEAVQKEKASPVVAQEQTPQVASLEKKGVTEIIEGKTPSQIAVKNNEEPPVAVEENVNILEEQVSDDNIADEDLAYIADDEIPVLLNVSYETSTNDKEMVLFKLSGFHPPVVFSTEGEELLVVCDFLDAILGYGVEKLLEANGNYIRNVEVSKQKEPEKVRVVLHLNGKFKYDLKQVFFKEDNLFVLIISSLGEKN